MKTLKSQIEEKIDRKRFNGISLSLESKQHSSAKDGNYPYQYFGVSDINMFTKGNTRQSNNSILKTNDHSANNKEEFSKFGTLSAAAKNQLISIETEIGSPSIVDRKKELEDILIERKKIQYEKSFIESRNSGNDKKAIKKLDELEKKLTNEFLKTCNKLGNDYFRDLKDPYDITESTQKKKKSLKSDKNIGYNSNETNNGKETNYKSELIRTKLAEVDLSKIKCKDAFFFKYDKLKKESLMKRSPAKMVKGESINLYRRGNPDSKTQSVVESVSPNIINIKIGNPQLQGQIFSVTGKDGNPNLICYSRENSKNIPVVTDYTPLKKLKKTRSIYKAPIFELIINKGNELKFPKPNIASEIDTEIPKPRMNKQKADIFFNKCFNWFKKKEIIAVNQKKKFETQELESGTFHPNTSFSSLPDGKKKAIRAIKAKSPSTNPNDNYLTKYSSKLSKSVYNPYKGPQNIERRINSRAK